MAQMIKRLSATQETQVRSLGWEDTLEKEMAAHSSILAWKIPSPPLVLFVVLLPKAHMTSHSRLSGSR